MNFILVYRLYTRMCFYVPRRENSFKKINAFNGYKNSTVLRNQ